jgi:hypothetical protein
MCISIFFTNRVILKASRPIYPFDQNGGEVVTKVLTADEWARCWQPGARAGRWQHHHLRALLHNHLRNSCKDPCWRSRSFGRSRRRPGRRWQAAAATRCAEHHGPAGGGIRHVQGRKAGDDRAEHSRGKPSLHNSNCGGFSNIACSPLTSATTWCRQPSPWP